VDPDTNIVYINSNEMAWTASLFEDKGEHGAKAIYLSQCAVCHGENMRGAPPDIPNLEGIGNRRSPADIAAAIRGGKGRMPGFPNLYEDQLNGLVEFLLTGENKELSSSGPPLPGMKYRLTGHLGGRSTPSTLIPASTSGRSTSGNIPNSRPKE
jgi:quinoprotein glucose dehydrogenase